MNLIRLRSWSFLFVGLLGATLSALAQSPQAPVNPGTVPEPATIGMIAIALAGSIGYAALRRRRK